MDIRVDETRHVGDVMYVQTGRPPLTEPVQPDTHVNETRVGARILANGIRPNGHAGR